MKKENEMTDKVKVPKNAFNFLLDTDIHCSFSDDESEKVSKFEMVGYSGEIIPNHWYWGNLAFDLDGFSFKEKFPILWSHDHFDLDSILGYSTEPTINDRGLVFTENEVTFVDSEKTKKFKEFSKKGVPFQASISGKPTKIEFIEEGEEAMVNGRVLKGPGHIWRQTNFRECSVCVFGADEHTSSKMFTEAGEGEVELDTSVFISSLNDKDNQNQNQMETFMDYLTFRKEHPEEAQKFTDLILEDATNKFAKEKDQLIADHEAEKKSFNEKIESLEETVKQYEKEKTIAEEKARKEFADATWDSKLKEAGIPERLHEKVKAFVSSEKYFVEGEFDKDAFVAAVEKEIEFWAETATDEDAVQGGGGGFTKKIAGETEFDDKEAEVTADVLLGLVR
jgi:hypothetical protein